MYKFSESALSVGISACLLGEKVRYNGGHKRADFCTEVLARHVNFVPVCPEMAIGLGTPRPAIRLVRRGDTLIAGGAEGDDIADRLTAFARRQARPFESLSGYIVCAKSPSCGMERVPVYSDDGSRYRKEGTGLYTAELMRALPLLPVEEDGRLRDPVLRENFVTRLYAYHDWQCLIRRGLTAAALIAFHSRYKYVLLAHHPESYRRLGRLISDLSTGLGRKADTYIAAFMAALRKRASIRNHSNVLQHLQGHFKRRLTPRQRRELAGLIDNYRKGIVPLLAPLTLLRHHLAEHPDDYVARQRYIDPYPESLGLRHGF